MECKCGECGKTFNLRPSLLARRKAVYCSRKCLDARYARTRMPMACAQCGKQVLRYKSIVALNERSFCNPQCQVAYRRVQMTEQWATGAMASNLVKVEVPCAECGKSMLRTRQGVRSANYCKPCKAERRNALRRKGPPIAKPRTPKRVKTAAPPPPPVTVVQSLLTTKW